MNSHPHYGPAVLAAVAILLTGALAGADDDVAIRNAIEARLQKEKLVHQADVRVDVRSGEVTLTGLTTTLPAKRRAEKLARKEARTVHNELRVRLEEAVKDSDVVEGVRGAILRDPRYDVFDYVEFAVKDGAVVLLGSVIQPWKKSSIEARVAGVSGVRAIQNDITVQSQSRFDSSLRASLYRQIYGDMRFIQYRHRSHPPIRILVDKGHIVLAGWVQSPVEKVVLGHIALGTLSFSVENRLQVDDEGSEEDSKKKSAQS